jgi:hypothetical protein
MVVPRFVRQAIEGKPLTVYGDGDQLRSFTATATMLSVPLGRPANGVWPTRSLPCVCASYRSASESFKLFCG